MITVGQGKTRIPVRSLWLLLIYASDMLEDLRTDERQALLAGSRDADLADAIAEVLVVEVERRLRHNLTVKYRTRVDDLTRVRGRIDHLRTSSARLMDRGQVACRFDELTADTVRNQFVCRALRWASRIVQSMPLASRCRTAAFRMERLGVTDRAPTRSEMSQDRLSHHDAADRRMLDAAKLIYDMALPVHAAGNRVLPTLEHDDRVLRDLFEDAVRGFFTYSLDRNEWRVSRSTLVWKAAGDATSLALLPQLKTDTVLDQKSSTRRIVVETKFTNALTVNYGSTKVKPGFMFQLYAYLMSQTGAGDPAADRAEGVLLFALTEGQTPVESEVEIQSHRVRVLSVDLSGTPPEIREQWLRCVS
ncbi:5-methylcytosine restriction system specificity protein McrC [Rhodococcus sp. JS3073]|uniref:5-methylcytosine restriction system specificity protein McrC n=1 Tax=Rhodococcus sp. JS3073 TaxID=3002901 RepID=UPI002285FE5F|nr:hypothetical protein [Rhodococcus sp. JS3073]WAM20017.1 hypothetical protein OYT95_41010 [Rhodococcus sp. JS3073]